MSRNLQGQQSPLGKVYYFFKWKLQFFDEIYNTQPCTS
jgi:hypothetical protein